MKKFGTIQTNTWKKFNSNMTEKKFKPVFLHDLVNDLYEDKPDVIKEHALKEIFESENNKGVFWERCLEKWMPFTERLKHNAWHRDFTDNTDAKLATAIRYSNNASQATIGGLENKIGHLRVCLVAPGDKRKVFFMLIPPEYYKRSKHPIKVTFNNFVPSGAVWDKFQCSWEEVIAPIVDTEPEIVYTDEYQLLLESLS